MLGTPVWEAIALGRGACWEGGRGTGWREVAYLTDRVLLAEGKQQEYGTQATGRDGGFVARDLRDPAGVNERRARMGLGPLAAYLEQLATSYGPPEPATLTCRACGTAVEFWLPEDTEPRTLDCPGCGERITVRVTR